MSSAYAGNAAVVAENALKPRKTQGLPRAAVQYEPATEPAKSAGNPANGGRVLDRQFAGRPRYAPPGYHWRCTACGKVSLRDRFGIEPGADRGWDAACMLHAELVKGERRE